jgi:molecular chaperone DnaJ
LRLAGRGAAGPRGGGAGDLYVHLRVAPHERYARQGDDLVTDLDLTVAQAALGTRFTLPTLDGDEEITIPAGTQPGREFVYRHRGVPRLQGRGRGDLRVRAVVHVPTDLDDNQAQLLRQFAESRGEQLEATEPGGLFSRIKSAFS